jgi:hypothetical protein
MLDSSHSSVPDQSQEYTSNGSKTSVPSPLAINSTHLKLLHHYTTVTSYTLSPGNLLRTLWRVEVPKLAFEHDFLMRGILALSALHLSRLSPQKEEFYLSVARREHSNALPEASSLLSNVTSENCAPLYAFSVLTFIYSWASSQRSESGEVPFVHNPADSEWLVLLRGIRSIGQTSKDDLLQSPIGSLISLGTLRMTARVLPLQASPWWASTAEHLQIERLRRQITTTTTDPELIMVYMTSIDNLETSFCSLAVAEQDIHLDEDAPVQSDRSNVTNHRTSSGGTVYTWLYVASDKYLELLADSNPEALVIFAYWAVVLNTVDSCWWMQGWGRRIIQAVWDLLDLDYRLWIQWPMEEIGWTSEHRT